MPPTPTTQRMGELHEQHLAEIFGGRKTKDSGSQWTDPADGANHHDDPFAFRWDGKSTKAASIAVTLKMIEKICEQAGGERPGLAFLFYGNDALTKVLADWVAVKDVDFSEVLEAARAFAEVVAYLRRIEAIDPGVYATPAGVIEAFSSLITEHEGSQIAYEAIAGELEALRGQLTVAEEALATARSTTGVIVAGGGGGSSSSAGGGGGGASGTSGIAAVGGGGGGGGGVAVSAPPVPEYIPQLPWTVVHQVHLEDRTALSGLQYDQLGHRQTFEVKTVVVERALDGSNRPRLMVNGVRVPHGDLYVDGKLHTRAAASDPSIEVG